MYQEYLNNRYLQVYVNDSVQTNGWAIIVLAVILVLGAPTLALLLRNKTMEMKVETVSTQAEVAAPDSKETSSKVLEAFHPVVAALKAELSNRPVPTMVMPILRPEEPGTAFAQQPVVTGPTSPLDAPSTGTVPVQKKAEPEKRPAEERASPQ